MRTALRSPQLPGLSPQERLKILRSAGYHARSGARSVDGILALLRVDHPSLRLDTNQGNEARELVGQALAEAGQFFDHRRPRR